MSLGSTTRLVHGLLPMNPEWSRDNAYNKATFGMAQGGAPNDRKSPLVLMVFASREFYPRGPRRRQVKNERKEGLECSVFTTNHAITVHRSVGSVEG